MKKTLMILKEPSKADYICIVHRPSVGEPHFYREGVSLDSFRNRELQRSYPNKHDSIKWCMVELDCEKFISSHNQFWREYEPERVIDDAALPIFDNIYEFYSAIGYCRKKKRYK